VDGDRLALDALEAHAEQARHLAGLAAGLEERPVRELFHGEPRGLHPGHGRRIDTGWLPKALAKLLGGDPLPVVGRGGILLRALQRRERLGLGDAKRDTEVDRRLIGDGGGCRRCPEGNAQAESERKRGVEHGISLGLLGCSDG
jgi:hypothetical protein